MGKRLFTRQILFHLAVYQKAGGRETLLPHAMNSNETSPDGAIETCKGLGLRYDYEYPTKHLEIIISPKHLNVFRRTSRTGSLKGVEHET